MNELRAIVFPPVAKSIIINRETNTGSTLGSRDGRVYGVRSLQYLIR
jgi:hypothetical protein